MKKENPKKAKASGLREKAENKLKSASTPIENLSEADVRKLAHELQVHQVELEMQNEELRKAQIEIEKSHQKYTDLYDFAPVGYLTISEEGIILEANLTFALMVGMERGLLIKKRLSSFIVREDQDILFLHHKQVLKTKKLETCKLRMMKKDGTHFYVQLQTEIVLDHNDYQYRVIVTDITERKKMEEMLLQSEKLKSLGTITAGISHEFNNILAIISGNVQLLEDTYKDHEELSEALRTIKRVTNDGAEISRRMLKFTKTDKDTAGFAPFDINELINQAIEFTTPRWKNMAQAKGLNYHIDTEGMKAIPFILCNPTELREVFVNIINNALDAMPDDGRITFRTWSEEDSVFIGVTDTGEGMSEEVKKNIFDPFFTTKTVVGTGLGMSTAYGIVTAHGGRIDVESTVGSGSTFTLQFPAATEADRPEESPEPRQEVKSSSSLRILVVDDEEDICEILDRYFSEKGHLVRTVDNGKEAIILAKAADYDLVLTDLAMPNVYGYDVIKAFNNLEKRPKIGIITGWGEKLKPIDDEEFKVDFIIKKPFDLSELSKHINELGI